MPSDVPIEIPPHAVARYDQALRESEQVLADLIVVYKQMRAAHVEMGLPESVTVVGCCEWLADEVPAEVCASALAVAILAFVRSRGEQ